MMEFKPCPFCGKDVVTAVCVAELEHMDDGDPYYDRALHKFAAVCNYTAGGCGASTGFWYDSRSAAIESWNRRAE